MVAARTMTRLTLQLTVTERTIGIGGHGMLRAEDGQRLLIIMTGKAGVGALPAITWFILLRRLRSDQAGK